MLPLTPPSPPLHFTVHTAVASGCNFGVTSLRSHSLSYFLLPLTSDDAAGLFYAGLNFGAVALFGLLCPLAPSLLRVTSLASHYINLLPQLPDGSHLARAHGASRNRGRPPQLAPFHSPPHRNRVEGSVRQSVSPKKGAAGRGASIPVRHIMHSTRQFRRRADGQ